MGAGPEMDLTLAFQGQTVRAYSNGTLRLTATLTRPAAPGKAGFRTQGGSVTTGYHLAEIGAVG